MSSFNDVTSIMNKSELKGFIQYLSARNKRTDTRNIDLFKAIIKGREEAIKKEIGANAYNVLNKRLSDRILDFMATTTLESEATEEIGIIKQILIGRRLFVHKKYKIAYKVFAKAERKAIQIGHYTLLNEIYHTYIQYSYLELSPDQESLFKRFEENKQEFIEQERLNMAYAVIKKAFNQIEHSSATINLNDLVQETFARFGISNTRGYNFKSLYQIAQIADLSGAYNKNYHIIDLFFVDKVAELENGAGDTEKFLIYHIDVLYLIANIYFRKRMFGKSLEFLAKMKIQMNRSNKRHYDSKLVQYSTLKALNLNYNGDYKVAIQELDTLINSKKYRFDLLLNPYLIRTMIHFQHDELQEAQRLLAQFNRTDVWYERKMGLEWTLNKKYIEILLHIELGNVDYVDSRINSLVKKYGGLLKLGKEAHVLKFLKLVKKYYQNPEVINTSKFREQVENTIEFKPIEQEDIILMSFYAWLKAKMEKTPLYSTTVNLVKISD